MKKLSDLKQNEIGIIKKIDAPEKVMKLVHMGCCIGSEVEVKHSAPLNGPMALCTCGRVLAVRREAAAHLWVKIKKKCIEVI
jgi:Fe2+ transport system protein FeoA